MPSLPQSFGETLAFSATMNCSSNSLISRYFYVYFKCFVCGRYLSICDFSCFFVYLYSFRRSAGRAGRFEEIWASFRETFDRETHIGILNFLLFLIGILHCLVLQKNRPNGVALRPEEKPTHLFLPFAPCFAPLLELL